MNLYVLYVGTPGDHPTPRVTRVETKTNEAASEVSHNAIRGTPREGATANFFPIWATGRQIFHPSRVQIISLPFCDTPPKFLELTFMTGWVVSSFHPPILSTIVGLSEHWCDVSYLTNGIKFDECTCVNVRPFLQ